MEYDECVLGDAPVAPPALAPAAYRRLAEERAIDAERHHENVLIVAEPRRELALQPLGADDVGVGLPQRLQRLAQESIAHPLAPAAPASRGAQHDDGHKVMYRHDDGPPARGLDHVGVAVIEHVHEIRALRFPLDAPGIEVVARRPLLRAVERAGQDDARRIDGLRPPAHEGFAAVASLLGGPGATAGGVPREGTDVGG